MKSCSFTMTELLVVIAIIGILSSILFPALNKASELAGKISCMNRIRQCGIAMMQYTNDNNGRAVATTYNGVTQVPWGQVLYESGTILNKDIFLCPKMNPKPFLNWYRTYGVRSPYYIDSAYRGDVGNIMNTFPFFYKIPNPSRYAFLTDSAFEFSSGVFLQCWSFSMFLSATSDQGAHMRHLNFCNISFADGHAEGKNTSALRALGFSRVFTLNFAIQPL